MKLNRPASAVLLSGLAVRLGLAPFTGHPGDMALFVTSQRLFYQTGTIDLKYFPTLPAVYYLQLLFYAPYQLLRLMGMPDFQVYFNTTMMIETLFLKLPLILCDAGIFFVLLSFTRKLIPATLFFLNPFPILLSSVWGTYDSMMLFPLMLGLYFLAKRESRTTSGFAFVISGLFKLFGFVSFALVVCESIIRRRFHDELPLEILGGLAIVAATLSPVFLLGGGSSFLQVLVYRFIGLSSGTGGTQYGLLAEFFKVNPSGILPTLPVALALTCLGYSYESIRAKQSPSLLVVKWTLVAALAFNVFSASEPQWLSWLVPLGILYGALSGRMGIQYFTCVFGTLATFLTITLLQGTAYMLVGSSTAFILGYVEWIPGGLFLYTLMIAIMIVMFCGYSFSKKLKSFRLEVIPLTVLLYLQLYFWIVIIGVGRFVGVS
jgi:hypothetical protein